MVSQAGSDGIGLNLHIYPSDLVGASRVEKVASSIQATGRFAETHAVGIQPGHLLDREVISPNTYIIRVPGSRRKGTLGRIFKALLWQPNVYRRYKDQNVSALAAHNVWVLPMAHRLSRKTGAVLAYNAHELETETAAIKGIKQQLARFIERRYIRHADIVSVVNKPIADWYSERYPGQQPIPLSNTPLDDGSSVDLRSMLNIPDDELIYIHTGHLVEGRNIPLILKTFTDRSDSHVVFLGDGPFRMCVEDAAKNYSNIHWLPPVAPSSVVSYVRGADVGLCLIERVSLSYKLSTPNKLMEALGAGIPPLTSDLVEARRLLGSHAKEWVLKSPDKELPAALKRIDKKAVENFKNTWVGLPTWGEQVAPLILAYGSALDHRREFQS